MPARGSAAWSDPARSIRWRASQPGLPSWQVSPSHFFSARHGPDALWPVFVSDRVPVLSSVVFLPVVTALPQGAQRFAAGTPGGFLFQGDRGFPHPFGQRLLSAPVPAAYPGVLFARF